MKLLYSVIDKFNINEKKFTSMNNSKFKDILLKIKEIKLFN